MTLNEPVFLSPCKKLVDAVADWLTGHARKDKKVGADSLAHICVVVPTAQSGRNLRLALAKRFPNGLVPPMVVLPMRLVAPADESLPEASDAEVAALFLKFAETRPRRHLDEGKGVELDEWANLFEPKSFGDHDALFSFLDQLSDIWRILGANGMRMGDVLKADAARKVLEEAFGAEMDRWGELAELEEAFFDFMHKHNLRHRAESIHLAKMAPQALPEEIEEVILPALADPVPVLYDVLNGQRDSLKVTVLLHCVEKDRSKFDEWGRPEVECRTGDKRPVIGWRPAADGQREAVFTEEDIFRASNFSALAKQLVADFPSVDSQKALPSLALCDSDVFPEVSSAFLNAGYVVHNPESHRLIDSSLGRLVRSLFDVWRVPAAGLPWDSLVSFLRTDDVLSALKRAQVIESRTAVLNGLDIFQNKYLPTFLPETLVFPSVVLNEKYEKPAVDAFLTAVRAIMKWLRDARGKESLAEFARHFLKCVFKHKFMRGSAPTQGRDDNPRDREGDKEFRAAAGCVWQLLDSLSSEKVGECKLSDKDIVALAQRLLGNASYSLEPESRDAVKTEGWLELAWSECDKLALAGFHEGAVPDSVIGHAFLPDRLRAALGLTSNVRRLARDTWLFKELVDSHDPHAIHAYVASANNAGDICRPSRLLFLCGDNELAKRTGFLFGATGSADTTPPRKPPKGIWRLKLPDEVPLRKGHLSSSAIDAYLNSPFVYLLQYGMEMEKYEDKRELGFDDFGTLVHNVLQTYAQEQFDKGLDEQLADAEAIRQRLSEIMDKQFAVFGEHPTTNVKIQLDSLRGRLLAFADIQATWAKDGWRVAAKPEYAFEVAPFDDLDIKIKGSVDRVDGRMDADGRMVYRIIDYKTWDRVESASSHIQNSSAKQIAFADKLNLPTGECDKGCGKRRMLTTQLPLYGKCLEKTDPEKFFEKGRIVDYCYLILGEDADNVKPYGSCLPFGGKNPLAQSIKIAELAGLSLETAETAIRRIQANIFWPPLPSEDTGLYEYEDLVMLSPELDQGTDGEVNEWLAKQMKKLEEL